LPFKWNPLFGDTSIRKILSFLVGDGNASDRKIRAMQEWRYLEENIFITPSVTLIE